MNRNDTPAQALDEEARHELHDAVSRHLVRYGGDFFPEIVLAARGSRVWDENGRAILDFTSGQMCATLGHSHPAVVAAIETSARKAVHLFSGMIPDTVARLAARLAAIAPPPLAKSLFVSTGSESNEAAVKMAKLCTGGFEVLGLGGSWHGVTSGVSAVSFASDRRGYGPAMPGTHAIPEPNAYRCPVEHCRDRCDMTCLRVGLRMFDMQSAGEAAALVAEPVLSAGGVIVPPPGYFDELQRECRARGMMLIFDEAQTAFGRIGANFAASKLGVVPDILTMSKTLGGGIPLAGLITTEAIETKAHERGFAHYTSHVSDPLPAAVGLAVLETVQREGLTARAEEMGAYLRARLGELQQRHAPIGDVRGEGLLIGVELVRDRHTREPYHELGAMTTRRCFELGLSMNIRRRPERGSVWRIAPPLTVTRDEIDAAVTILDQALSESLDALARGADPAPRGVPTSDWGDIIMITRGFKKLMAEANAVVDTVSVHDALGMLDDADVLFVDVRETVERQETGTIPGSVHAPRGFLELIADPEGPMHNDALASGKRLLLFCGTGGRSTLAAKTLLDMGLDNVASVSGGLGAWKEAGGPIEK